MGERGRRILVLVALGALGCISPDRLKVRDEGVLFPTLRIRHGFGEKPEPDAPPQGWRRALELELTGADGETEGKEYKFVQATLGGRVETAGERFDFAGLFGFGYTEVDFRNNAINFQSTAAQFGVHFGVEGGVRLFKRARLYGRVSALMMPLSSKSDTLEAGISYRFTRNVSLLAGYRRWRFEEENFSFLGADLDLRVEGIFLGLGLDF